MAKHEVTQYTPIKVWTICKNGSEKLGAKASTFMNRKGNDMRIEVEVYGKTKKLAEERLINFLSDDGETEIELSTEPIKIKQS